MLGEKIDSRRWYGRFDKREMLKKTGGKCACCGIKLNENTMTVEHIIPISRGGWDIESNILPLCKECNKLKDNKLYIPQWFYTALAGTSLLQKTTDDFCEWFKNIKDKFNIQQFPLIAPRNNFLLMPPTRDHTGKKRKTVFLPQAVLTWSLVGMAEQEEAEHITGVRISEAYRTLIDISGRKDYKGPMSAYVCKKISTGNIMAMAGIMYSLSEKRAYIIVPWAEIAKIFKPCVLFSIIRIFYTAMEYGGYPLEETWLYLPGEMQDTMNAIARDYAKNIAALKKKTLYGVTKTIYEKNTGRMWTGLNIHECSILDPEAVSRAMKEKSKDI